MAEMDKYPAIVSFEDIFGNHVHVGDLALYSGSLVLIREIRQRQDAKKNSYYAWGRTWVRHIGIYPSGLRNAATSKVAGYYVGLGSVGAFGTLDEQAQYIKEHYSKIVVKATITSLQAETVKTDDTITEDDDDGGVDGAEEFFEDALGGSFSK